ncbi:hypothetical protein GVAV_003211 [Gurleya vavrai]
MRMEKSGKLGTCEDLVNLMRVKIIDLKKKLYEIGEKEKIEKEKIELKKKVDELAAILMRRGPGNTRRNMEQQKRFGSRIQYKISCYVCGEAGHKAFACPKRISKENNNYLSFNNFYKRTKINTKIYTIENLI